MAPFPVAGPLELDLVAVSIHEPRHQKHHRAGREQRDIPGRRASQPRAEEHDVVRAVDEVEHERGVERHELDDRDHGGVHDRVDLEKVRVQERRVRELDPHERQHPEAHGAEPAARVTHEAARKRRDPQRVEKHKIPKLEPPREHGDERHAQRQRDEQRRRQREHRRERHEHGREARRHEKARDAQRHGDGVARRDGVAHAVHPPSERATRAPAARRAERARTERWLRFRWGAVPPWATGRVAGRDGWV